MRLRQQADLLGHGVTSLETYEDDWWDETKQEPPLVIPSKAQLFHKQQRKEEDDRLIASSTKLLSRDDPDEQPVSRLVLSHATGFMQPRHNTIAQQ